MAIYLFISYTTNQRSHLHNVIEYFVTRYFYKYTQLFVNAFNGEIHKQNAQCKRHILISIVINVNLGIHTVKPQKLQSVLQPKIMERLAKFLPTTFIKVLNYVGGGGTKNNRGLFSAVVQEFQ